MIIIEPVAVDMDFEKHYIRDTNTNQIYRIDRFDASDNTILASNATLYAIDWRSFNCDSEDLLKSSFIFKCLGATNEAFASIERRTSVCGFFGEQCDNI